MPRDHSVPSPPVTQSPTLSFLSPRVPQTSANSGYIEVLFSLPLSSLEPKGLIELFLNSLPTKAYPWRFWISHPSPRRKELSKFSERFPKNLSMPSVLVGARAQGLCIETKNKSLIASTLESGASNRGALRHSPPMHLSDIFKWCHLSAWVCPLQQPLFPEKQPLSIVVRCDR